MTVEKRGNRYCVVHGHAQKPGSKTDKPPGTVIKCFDNPEDAYKMHYAIVKSQERGDSTFIHVDSDSKIVTIVNLDTYAMAPGGPKWGYEYLDTIDIRISDITPADIKKARGIVRPSYSTDFPIAVEKVGGKYDVIDGMHRLAEALKNGETRLTVNVFKSV